MRTGKREVLTVLVSTMLALVIAEAAFRFYLRYQARADLQRVARGADITTVDTCNLGDIVRLSHEPDLFYELKPNLHGHFCGGSITTNALGMRMPNEPALDKPDGVLRVVALGDSYLFAQRMDDGQGFLEVLRSRARESGKPIEFLNFGVPGYNTWMEGVVLGKRARYFAPDVILVSVTGNDWDLPGFMLSRPYGDVGHSFLLGALLERLRAPPELVETPKSKVFEDHYLAVPDEVPPEFRHMVGFEGYRRALRRMLDVAVELRAKLVLFSDCVSDIAPGTRSCSFPFAAGQYERVRSEVYADAYVVVCPWQLSQELLIPHDGHPNVEGHRSLADQLSACLEAHGLHL
jgi:lysophospholipase L1-like esterase